MAASCPILASLHRVVVRKAWFSNAIPAVARSMAVPGVIGPAPAEPFVASTATPAMPAAVQDGKAAAVADTPGAGPHAQVPARVGCVRIAQGKSAAPGTNAVRRFVGTMAKDRFLQRFRPIAAGNGPGAPARQSHWHRPGTARSLRGAARRGTVPMKHPDKLPRRHRRRGEDPV